MARLTRLILALALAAGFLQAATPALPVRSQEDNFLHTEGSRILDAAGNPVVITGISWFGLETENFAPHGLWARSMESMLDQIVEMGFNTIRVPYSNQLFDPASQPNGVSYDLNPDLKGLNGLEIMDRLIAGAGQRGLKVILDRHRPDSRAQSELWYTPQVSEERWIADWVMLAQRYAGDSTVIGADLHNEPHGTATWGTGDEATDWQLAAERAGNAILAVNPDWLIIVQGVEQYQGEFYWWGGNLMGVAEHPVRLNRPDKLVYSPHTYGPGVYPQKWFDDPRFPDNMPEVWDSHWGYVQKQGLAPLILGEFGGRSVQNDREGVWQRALVAYLKENGISYLYWSLNPNSGDTGGVLLDDWQTVDPNKEALLKSFQAPLIGSGQPAPAPSARPAQAATATPEPQAPDAAAATLAATAGSEAGATPTAAGATDAPATLASATLSPATDSLATPVSLAPAVDAGLRVKYHTSNPAARSSDSKPEFIVANTGAAAINLPDLELVYWFHDDPGQTYEFHCDWAQIGCEKLQGEFEALPDGLYALHVRFAPGAGSVPPGQESGEIKLRFNRVGFSEMDQSDDYSFAAAGAYEESERVALYLNGALAWGRPPGEAAGSPTSQPPSTAAPAGASTAIASSAGGYPAVGTPAATSPTSASGAGSASSGWMMWVIAGLAAVVGFALAVIVLGRRQR